MMMNFFRVYLLFFFTMNFGCDASNELRFFPNKSSDGVIFQLGYNNVNGLLGMVVWVEETRKPLWVLDLNYFDGSSIKYGVVPLDQKKAVKQVYPHEGGARPLPIGRTIMIKFEYQYDSLFGPSATSACYGFKLNADGEIVDFSERRYISSKGPVIPEN